MIQYFPKPFEPFGGDINFKVYLSNYATKTDFKNMTHVDVSNFALKSNLTSLKTEVDKLDINKLTSVPNDLAKLSNVVKNDVVKKIEVNNTDTTGFVLKTTYDADKSDLEKKISDSDTSDLAKKSDLNPNITEIENKIPSITGLATNSALTAVENKIPDVISLVKKTDYNKKVSEIENKFNDHSHDKYSTNPELNTLAVGAFDARLAQADLVTKTDFDAKMKKISDRVTSNKSKHLLVKSELKKLEKIDAAYFRGKNYFDGDGTQMVFQEVYKYFNSANNLVDSSQSKGLSDEKLSHIGKQTRRNFPKLEHDNARIKLKFKGSILKQSEPTDFGSIVNIYIVSSLIPKTNGYNIVLKNCLSGSIDITKNAYPGKYTYSGGIGIGFDSKGEYTHPDGGIGRNVIIFGTDMTNSKHANNETKYVLVLGRGLTQKIDSTAIYTKKIFSPNFSVENKTFCLSLHYCSDDSYLFVNGKEATKFKAKIFLMVNTYFKCA